MSRFRSQFIEAARAGLARGADTARLTEADLVPLPEPVRRHLRLV